MPERAKCRAVIPESSGAFRDTAQSGNCAAHGSIKKMTAMNKQANSAAQSATNSIGVVQKNLSRAIFDALLERDLLGFLLSSKHFSIFLSQMEFDAGDQEIALAESLLGAPFRLNGFQAFMLDMYSGVYIEECQHKTIESLMLDLDLKAAEMMLTSNGQHSGKEIQINHVELAWRYRHHCSGSGPLNF